MATGAINPDMVPGTDPTVESMRGRYYGEHTGYVRDRNDPQQRGRVRVYVPGISSVDDTADTWLDWATPSSAGLMVPPLGWTVHVTFEQGDICHPIYKWGWVKGNSKATSTLPAAAKGNQDPTWSSTESAAGAGQGASVTIASAADTAKATPPVYPYNKVLETESGHILELDDSPNAPRARYRHPSGASLTISPDGRMTFEAPEGFDFRSGGDFNVSLAAGSTFKVAYPGGAALAVGPSGVHSSGPQVTLLGRAVEPSGNSIR